jgi:hypothetical protein
MFTTTKVIYFYLLLNNISKQYKQFINNIFCIDKVRC